MGMVAQSFLTHQKFRVLVVEVLSSLLSLHSTSFTQGFLYMQCVIRNKSNRMLVVNYYVTFVAL